MHSGAVNPHDQFLKEGWPIVSFLHTSGCVRAPLGFTTKIKFPEREIVFFIRTQFSILYTSMYSPAEARLRVLDVCGFV